MKSVGIVAHAPLDLRLESMPLLPAAPDEAIVRIRYGGICGSDLHYWQHGSVGTSVMREPLLLGHEVVGTIESPAADGSGPAAGTPVFVHPATTCGVCAYCRAGRENLCVELRYFGSAARYPHTPGAFATRIIAPAGKLLDIAGLAPEAAALIEPAAVAWHAVSRLGSVGVPLSGRVAVIGSGPIGLLVVAALKARSTAIEILSTDIAERPLSVARRVGAVQTSLAADAEQSLAAFGPTIVFETSGSRPGFDLALRAVTAGGTVVAVGQLPPDIPSAVQAIVGRELIVTGSSRFDHDAAPVIDALRDGGLVVDGIVSHVYPAADYATAFEVAADSSISSKVLLDFGDIDLADAGSDLADSGEVGTR